MGHEPYIRLKAALRDKGISYADVGHIINESRRAIFKKINGKTDFTLTEFIAICKAFNLSPDVCLEYG